MDKLRGWRFDRESDGWRWQFEDPLDASRKKQSDQPFASMLDCLSDAAKHGYIRHAGYRPDLG